MSEQTTTEEIKKEEAENVADINDAKEAKADEVETKKEEEKPAEPDYKEKFYYLAAEMENLKRRSEREKANVIKFGMENTLKDLVDVMDNFERTLDAISKDEDEKVKNIASGIEMVKKQFLDVLTKQGLETVEAKGKEFDPNFHEAMAQQEVEGTDAGVVVEEYQRGYVLNGRLLRAAKVIVSK